MPEKKVLKKPKIGEKKLKEKRNKRNK